MWCISEFTLDNGPLRVVPGSHAAPAPPIDPNGFGSGMGPHPDEVRIEAPAGSAILFTSGAIWHSGTFNYSPAPRIALTGRHTPVRLRDQERASRTGQPVRA
jgi:ectoine hydroxylase-related dioxygenase (phytanoyl-CoA dioxygenase family)